MKKIIALLLALMMTFSVATVAFATEAEAPAEDTETTAPVETPEEDKKISDQLGEMLGEYEKLLDLPFGVVGPALKIAKIALKFLKVYLKICDVFHLDPVDTAYAIFDYVGGVLEDNGVELPELGGEEEAPAEPETTAPAAA